MVSGALRGTIDDRDSTWCALHSWLSPASVIVLVVAVAVAWGAGSKVARSSSICE